jgi:hypothetical protein
MDDFAAERANPLDCRSEVHYREIREREAVARAGTALVQSEHDPGVVGLPAAPFLGSAALERHLEQLFPEAWRALGLVGGKLDQDPRRQRSHGSGGAAPPIVIAR